jgi:hypothetical protein
MWMVRFALLLPALLVPALFLTAMSRPPPYVNPLPPEVLDALRFSDISFDATQLPPTRSELAIGKAEALVQRRLLERLGSQFTPDKGNAVLVVYVRGFDLVGTFDRPEEIRLSLGADVVQDGKAVHYESGAQIVGRVQTSRGEIDASERLPLAAKQAADNLYNLIFYK